MTGVSSVCSYTTSLETIKLCIYFLKDHWNIGCMNCESFPFQNQLMYTTKVLKEEIMQPIFQWTAMRKYIFSVHMVYLNYSYGILAITWHQINRNIWNKPSIMISYFLINQLAIRLHATTIYTSLQDHNYNHSFNKYADIYQLLLLPV